MTAAALRAGEFIDPARIARETNRCPDRSVVPGSSTDRDTVREVCCQLERHHGGSHADVSLSGLVLDTWPGCDCDGCDSGLGCDYEEG